MFCEKKIMKRATLMNQKKLLNQEQLKDAIMGGVTLIDFNAPWCAPCQAQKPILDQLEREYHGKFSVMVLDVDEHRESAMAFGITSIPTLIIFKEGKEVERFIGLQNAKALSIVIDKALAG
jgi:thioredoxin 1